MTADELAIVKASMTLEERKIRNEWIKAAERRALVGLADGRIARLVYYAKWGFKAKLLIDGRHVNVTIDQLTTIYDEGAP